VHAETAPDDPIAAIRICTRSVPTHELPQTTMPTAAEIPGLHAAMLDMRVLAETPAADLPTTLGPLPTAYATWIARQAARVTAGADGLDTYPEAAAQALSRCRAALARIQARIAPLGRDPPA